MGDDDPEAHLWQRSGHKLLGLSLVRYFSAGRTATATVTKWFEAPPDDPLGHLFHLDHDDGDKEDLDEEELLHYVEVHRRKEKGLATDESEPEDDGSNSPKTSAGKAEKRSPNENEPKQGKKRKKKQRQQISSSQEKRVLAGLNKYYEQIDETELEFG